jgi:ribosomal protein L7/L12
MVEQSRPPPSTKGSLDASAGARRIDVALGREIADLLEAGRRPEAVALVRERTGWSLSEANEAVEKLERLRKKLG